MMKRLSALALLLCLCLAPSLSAQAPLPFPVPTGSPTEYWAVQITPNTDPQATAAALGFTYVGPVGTLDGWHLFKATGARSDDQALTATLRGAIGVNNVQPQIALARAPRGVEAHITDPAFPRQWHLNNLGYLNGSTLQGLSQDINVFGAWNHSVTCCDGTGIVVASVDDGVKWQQPDILPNYRPDLSYDYDNDDLDPSYTDFWSHGTPVASLMAGADDGAVCGVGVAYRAGIAGIQMLQSYHIDAVEAMSLSHRLQDIHVYNSSWGPLDTGAFLEGPLPLTAQAIQDGITEGRGGLGALYVWAGGNGRENGDHANADGYANSPYTITVAATNDRGLPAWYSEMGPNLLVNAPSSGGFRGQTAASGFNVGRSTCDDDFGGTSGAAPVVAGVIALMLEANPNLTWRDVQYILIHSAERNRPGHSSWRQNAAGYFYSHFFGFGRVDATRAVDLASRWDSVPANLPPLTNINTQQANIPDATGFGREAGVYQTTLDIAEQRMLEHVQITVNYTAARRGDLRFVLTSPSGTRSELLPPRPNDNANGSQGITWTFSSNEFWGESSQGTWTLQVKDHVQGNLAAFTSWSLTLHNIAYQPHVLTDTGVRVGVAGSTETIAPVVIAPPSTTAQWLRMETNGAVPVNQPLSYTEGNTEYVLRNTFNSQAYDSGVVVLSGVASIQLSTNGDLEIPNPRTTRRPADWHTVSASGRDRRICDANGCYYRLFSNGSTEATELRQYVTRPAANSPVRLTFSLNASLESAAHTSARARVILFVSYTNGQISRCRVWVTPSTTPQNATCSLTTTGQPIASITAAVRNVTPTFGHTVRIDDLVVTASQP
jgi:subtilisin-like proprotein convertase family protein